ncbi:MAG: FAD-dependent oxidoreductase, partial [Planctomycetes bacterium]|nr:FAD-dependent oxidoreductase [Planctomycetota bacterium]
TLFDTGYDAVYVAIGTQLARSLPINGIDLPVVSNGLDFLKAVNRGEDPRLAGNVVVLGGGNVAIDVAMTALRQGAKKVSMACLEQADEMPAAADEIRSAKEEGVRIENGWGPEAIYEDAKSKNQADFRIDLKCCTRVFDDEGRFSPEFDTENINTLDVDHVILAIGQAADLTCVMAVDEIDISSGLICVDEKTSVTADPRVFAGGDVVTGPSIAINAVRAGKQAAESIDCFLKGQDLIKPAWSTPRPASQPAALTSDLSTRSHPRQAVLTERGPEERTCGYDCIEQSLPADAAHQEVARCLRCDICIGCGMCELVCSEMGFNALKFAETKAGRLMFNDFVGPQTACAGCGACDKVCPTNAIRVLRGAEQVSTEFTGTPVCTQPLAPCTVCGRPHVTERFQQGLTHKSTAIEGMAEVNGNICGLCARKASAKALKIAAHKHRG